jgi:Helix-turn-helix domain
MKTKYGLSSVTDLTALPAIMRPTQLLEILPISRNLLYDSLQSGALPAQRLGTTYLIFRDSLIAFLEGAPSVAKGGSQDDAR